MPISPKRKVANGILASLASQLSEYDSRLHRFLMRRLRKRDLAEDVAQQTYENVVRRFRASDPSEIDSMLAYIYTTAGRIAYDLIKKDAKEHGLRDEETSPDDLPSEADDIEQAVSNEQEMEARFQVIEAAMQSFSAAQREMLRLSALGCDIEEIAARLGYTPSTVERYLKLLRRACREAWQGD